MTDTRAMDRDRRRAAALRANLSRRKALARTLGSDDPAQAQAEVQPAAPAANSAGVAGGDGGVDGGHQLG
jgi:hypothetical protein